MKKLLAMVLVMIVLLAWTGVGALASGYVYGSTGDSFVRTGPGLDYNSFGTLYKGQSATYLDSISYDDRGVAWYRISWNGRAGWVSSRYTVLSGAGSYYGGDEYYGDFSAPDYSPYYDTVFGSTGDSFVRTGPGLGYNSFGTLYKGQSAAFLGNISYDSRGVAWYNIRFNGRSGWVSSRYTTIY